MKRGTRTSVIGIALASLGASVLLSSCGSSSAVAWIPVAKHGTTKWSSVEFAGVACPQVGACVAVGERSQGKRSQAVLVRQSGTTWGRPVPAGPWQDWVFGGFTLSLPEPLACSTTTSCVSSTNAESTLSLVSQAQGRWTEQHRFPFSDQDGLPGPAACSPGGACWTLVRQQANDSISTYVVGLDGGTWLPPYRLGGSDLRVAGHPPLIVTSRFISCGSVSSCTVAVVASATRAEEAFTQTERRGTWGPISIIPSSIISAATKRSAEAFDVSELPLGPALACPSSSTCLLGGFVGNELDSLQSGAIEQEVNGRWLPPVTGIGVAGGPYVDSRVTAVACHTAAFCIAGGDTGSANGRIDVPFAQAEVHGHWLPPIIMRRVDGGSQVGLWLTGGACSISTCAFFAELTGVKGWNTSIVATYRANRWQYSLVKIDGNSRDLDVTGLSCTSRQCWIVGNTMDHTGFVSTVPQL
jgi:hypothetical protein